VIYLKKSRDHNLVEKRKTKDNFTCQACNYFKKVGNNKYIIDVHHLRPLGQVQDITLTSIDDLICLCPNCHRIAHSKNGQPYSLDEVKLVLKGEI